MQGRTNLFKGIVYCLPGSRPMLRPLYCITRDNSSHCGRVVAGRCPFTGTTVIGQLLENISINETCRNNSRAGTLCGKCAPGTKLSLDTFGLECIDESKCMARNWASYFLIEVVIITAFFIVIVLFNIRATAECAILFITFAQIISLPINILSIQRDWSVLKVSTGNAKLLAQMVQAVYGIWSLQVPAFISLCVPQNLSSVQVFALQYTSTIYPLVFIGISYTLIKCYERNCRIVILLWTPFRKCCVRLRRRIDPKTTIIDTFVTFILLSYIKFTYISFIIISPTGLYDKNGSYIRAVMLYDGSTDYFKGDHIPFGVLALVILVVIVIPLPLMLLFYQFRWCQKILHCCYFDGHNAGLFVYAFNGGLKDGNDGTRDHRWFAGVQLLVRLVIFALYAFVGDYYLLYFLINLIIATYVVMIVIFSPYKRALFNKVDAIFGTFLCFVTVIALYNNLRSSYEAYQRDQSLVLLSFFYICLFMPAIYMGIYVVISLVQKLYLRRRNSTRDGLLDESISRNESPEHFSNQSGFNRNLRSPLNDSNRLLENEEYSWYYSYSEVSNINTNSSQNTGSTQNTVSIFNPPGSDQASRCNDTSSAPANNSRPNCKLSQSVKNKETSSAYMSLTPSPKTS